LQQQSKQGLLASDEGNRKQAAMLAAQALDSEGNDPSAALNHALKAHKLDHALVPAALVAARVYIAQNNKRKAAKILRATWSASPHPDLAEVMAHLAPGDSPETRFERVRDLVKTNSGSAEAAYSLARAAVEAQRWDVARSTLEPYLAERPQARICALMADIEDAAGDKGRSREWLARAIRAPRDPLWVSDGVASLRWVPVSPISGDIVPCQWKEPYEPAGAVEPPAKPAAAEGVAPAPAKIDAQRPPEAVKLPGPPDDPGTEPDDGARAISGS
jgi:HemY protein